MRALSILFLLAGCGSSSELIVVTVHADRSNLAELGVLVTLDGKQAMQPEVFSAGTSDFGLELPDGSRGSVSVLVGGFDGSNCEISFGQAGTTVTGPGRVNLTVTLGPVSPPKC